MTITSVGYRESIGWSAWAQVAASLGTDYGIGGAGDLEVSLLTPSTGVVSVAAGKAHGRGIVDTLDAAEEISGLTSANTWYTVVVRRDWTPGPGLEVTSIVALAGGSTRAIAPTRQSTPGATDDQPIALVHRGATALDQVVDLRCWWGNGGLAAASLDALAYLGRPGSVVWVGGSQFRRVGSSWVEDDGTVTAAQVSSGVLNLDRIPSLPASQITSGQIDSDRIPTTLTKDAFVVRGETPQMQLRDTGSTYDGVQYRAVDSTGAVRGILRFGPDGDVRLYAGSASYGTPIFLFNPDGSVWATRGGGDTIPRPLPFSTDDGERLVSFTERTSYTTDVFFRAGRFTKPPKVDVNIASGAGETAQWHARAIAINTSKFTLFLFRALGADPNAWDDVPVQWTATQVAP